ncbi:MAG TPA: DUF3656 domain-containing protein [Methylomirabilota bacterium]|nr:DUF3656 domain-containing protein [Methylomirabilota bacterium]
MKPLPRPELLAPAGDWECARAAVENGADAIYFGLERFNARMRAHNFTIADLPRLMEFLHQRGVRGYVTFNTLVFANELESAAEYLRSIIAAGVDAAIVQDVGICKLIRRLSPDFPIHASTQMTITSAAGVEFARSLGANLVVLARECSIPEIEKIRATVTDVSFPLEVFVHGALCVAYSGQCLTSESLGGRSANRGECAQACRMPYELFADGRKVELGDRRYLLSPQDLAGLNVLSNLVNAGVASLKIEGRLKSPEYVASITRTYRAALDAITGAAPFNKSQAHYELEMGFSRGLHTGWFNGINNQQLVHARFGKKRGVLLGKVARVLDNKVQISLQAPLKAGDGIVFDAGRPDEDEEGGRVYHVETRGKDAFLKFAPGGINWSRIHVGDHVWKTSDPELERNLRQTFTGDAIRFQRPIHLEVHGHAGASLTVIARDEAGHVAKALSEVPLAVAEKRPLTEELLREQLGRLGGTPFNLGALSNHLEGEVILPLSELNRLRRDLVAQLDEQRRAPKRWTLLEPEQPTQITAPRRPSHEENARQMVVLVRSLAQLQQVLPMGFRQIYCELEDPKKYRDAVALVKAHRGANLIPEIWVAPPRIFKMGEDWILNQVRSSEADGYLVRNYDHLRFFAADRKMGDFSLNIANPLTAEHFITNTGLERVTASYDLNVGQLEALLADAPAEWFEITLHQHMPMFHMEHCVFCAFLTTGTDYRTCGRPCEKQTVEIKDRVGARHPLKADAGCRNTVFNALAQTGAEYLDRFLAQGARTFRIEFLNETPAQVRETIAQYRRLFAGETTGAQLWRELKLTSQLGVTRGQIGKLG